MEENSNQQRRSSIEILQLSEKNTDTIKVKQDKNVSELTKSSIMRKGALKPQPDRLYSLKKIDDEN